MTFRACKYEKEITEALKQGYWPNVCTDELHSHVAGCESCRELILVTEIFQHAKRQSVLAAPPGSPELFWWRAQLRRRYAATAAVARPLTVAQIFAWITSVLVTIVFVVSQYHHGLRWESWGVPSSKILQMLATSIAGVNLLLFLPAIGIIVAVSGIVLYLTLERH